MSNKINSDEFRKASGLWATGVSIVTTADGSGKPFGLTMNSVTSLSLEPPLYIVNLDKGSDTLIALMESHAFCINVLASDQDELSNRFATKGDNKFQDVDYDTGVGDAPKLTGSLMSIECAVETIHDGGDHKIIVGLVKNISTADPESVKPLLYYRGKYANVE